MNKETSDGEQPDVRAKDYEEEMSVRDRRGRCRIGGRLSTDQDKINLTIHVHTLLIMLTKIARNKIGPATLCGRAASPPLRGSISS